jgi:hypothetical protein
MHRVEGDIVTPEVVIEDTEVVLYCPHLLKAEEAQECHFKAEDCHFKAQELFLLSGHWSRLYYFLFSLHSRKTCMSSMQEVWS